MRNLFSDNRATPFNRDNYDDLEALTTMSSGRTLSEDKEGELPNCFRIATNSLRFEIKFNSSYI